MYTDRRGVREGSAGIPEPDRKSRPGVCLPAPGPPMPVTPTPHPTQGPASAQGPTPRQALAQQRLGKPPVFVLSHIPPTTTHLFFFSHSLQFGPFPSCRTGCRAGGRGGGSPGP